MDLIGLIWFHGVFNHCRLFNAKSIFIHKTVLFQTIKFSINLKTVPVQFSNSVQFKCQNSPISTNTV